MAVPSYIEIDTPAGVRLGAGGTAVVTLGSLMHPMTALHPAPDSTNGPLKSDSHMVAGSPTTTGMRFIPWTQLDAFRTQGMNLIAANTAANDSGTSCAINGSTPRTWGFGTSQPNLIESDIDIAWITDAAVVIPVYFHWNGYTGSNQHDMRWCVEHENSLKQLRSNVYPNTPMPSSVSTARGLHYRRVEFSEQRQRQHRIFLPANCFFAGVWIDTSAAIRKAPPAFLYAGNGDSWQEPYRNNPSMQSPIAGAYPTGNYSTTSLPTEMCLAFGWVCARTAQGGTGPFNANDSSTPRPLNYTKPQGDSVFHGDSRLTDAATKFGPGSPLWIDIGGWNDGDFPGTPFSANMQARVAAGLDSLKAKGFKAVVGVSIQPVGSGATLDTNRAQSLLGQKAAYLARTEAAGGDGLVRGFLDLTPMWPNVSTSGQRGNNVNSADTIHLTSKGAEGTARYIKAGIAGFTVPASLVAAQFAAAA